VPTSTPASPSASSACSSLTLANVDRLLAFGVIAGLVLLLAWTRRRWGEPRLHLHGAAALWVLAVLLAAIIVWLALD
jgi:hypothetical protein